MLLSREEFPLKEMFWFSILFDLTVGSYRQRMTISIDFLGKVDKMSWLTESLAQKHPLLSELWSAVFLPWFPVVGAMGARLCFYPSLWSWGIPDLPTLLLFTSTNKTLKSASPGHWPHSFLGALFFYNCYLCASKAPPLYSVLLSTWILFQYVHT